MRGGQSARVVGIDGGVCLSAAKVEHHAQRRLGVRQALHGVADFLAALRELPLELRGERGAALAVKSLELLARQASPAPGEHSGARDYRQRK